MSDKKKSPPVAVCTDCREYSYDITRVNERCHKVYVGKRCKGVFGSVIGTNDWNECEHCHATGMIDDKECEYCGGYGWLLMRKQI